MVVSTKKIGVTICLLLFIISSLFADKSLVTFDQVTGFKIVSYDFSVKGKTKHFALRNEIVPDDGDPVFASEEAMIQALEGKKQQLINKRVFTSVEYRYDLESFVKGIAQYKVTFTIEDASTFLAIPYPKFDNDQTGLRLGVKVYDKNLFGTLGDLYMVGHVSQGNGGLDGWVNRQDYLEMTVKSVQIGNSIFGFSVDYSRTLNSPDGGVFNFDVDWTGLNLFGVGLSLSPWGYFSPSSDFLTWNPTEYGVSWTYGPFLQSDVPYTLNNTVKRHANLTKIYTNTTLSQQGLTLFGKNLGFDLSAETDSTDGTGVLDYLNVGAKVSMGFNLPFGFTWSTSAGSFAHFIPDAYPLAYSHLFSNSLSKSNIDWVGDFRKGLSYSLSYVTDVYPQPEYAKARTYWYVENKMQWFTILSDWLNPSIQFTGFLADDKGKTFLPSDSTASIADYFRGYLSKTIENSHLETALSYAAILNLNVTMNFIDFGFAKTYVNPFLDIGFFPTPSDPAEMTVLASAGGEGYVIFDKFPSYPIRGSLGFNLSDVRKAFDGEIDFTQMEWELSIGMGLFF